MLIDFVDLFRVAARLLQVLLSQDLKLGDTRLGGLPQLRDLLLLLVGQRAMLDAGPVEQPAWAISVLAVAGTVLVYHLLQLRSDLATAASTDEVRAVEPVAEPPMVVETIEISAPVGSPFDDVNATIRTELPAGYQMRVVSTSEALR